MTYWICAGVLASLAAGTALSQSVRQESILPHATDAAITQWTAAHLAALDTTRPQRGLLFVFLHGQGGTAATAGELIRTAAEEGFFSVGLTYPNDWTPFQFCSASNSDCYENMRREILDGVDRSTSLAVNQTNCVENRLVKLIAYLNTLHPSEGWGQFEDAGVPRWDTIVVWGHSQGGANAAVLARHHVLAGVCISAPAADFVGNQPATWWNTHATAPARYFGFCHTQDQLSSKVAAWNAIGMGVFGTPRDVSMVALPYENTHELSTSIAPAVAGQYHNSVVADPVTPRDVSGVPVYKPVWRHMMNRAAGCATDFDGNGTLDFFDYLDFVDALSASGRRADFNRDGSIDFFDYLDFVDQFSGGC